MVVTRFCPTPSGALHHGNLYVAILNQEFARRHAGRFLVQIDDVAAPAATPAIIEGILEDLEWLGICRRGQVLRNSRNKGAFLRFVDELAAKGTLGIERTTKGCCLARAEFLEERKPVPVHAVRASSCAPGWVGILIFASDPRHVLADSRPAIIREQGGTVRETYWCSDPKDEEPWLEFDLPAGARPDSLHLRWWLPKPREVEVLIRADAEPWRRAGLLTGEPERTLASPTPTAHFIASSQGEMAIPLVRTCAPRNEPCVRLCFRGMQSVERYRLRDSAGAEPIVYQDLCLGERTAPPMPAGELRSSILAQAASDAVLQPTHVIRGDDLVDFLDLYVRCLQMIGRVHPVLCHVPELVDEAGEKLSKSQNNAERLAEKLRAEGMTPAQARQWIIENAYRNVRQRTPLHDFDAQMALLSATVQ